MKKVNSLLAVCAVSLVLGAVSAEARHFHHMGNMGNQWVNFGALVPEQQANFTFPSTAMTGGYGECHALNLTEGRVILISPYDRTLILTPQNPDGTFNVTSNGFFYAKYTMKGPSGPMSVLSAPLTVVKATTSPFMSSSGGQAQASQVMLVCRTY